MSEKFDLEAALVTLESAKTSKWAADDLANWAYDNGRPALAEIARLRAENAVLKTKRRRKGVTTYPPSTTSAIQKP